MPKRYFKFSEQDQPDQIPSVLAGTHGVEQTVAALKDAGFIVEEVTAKQAARIRRRQNQKEQMEAKIERAMEQ